MKVALIIFFSFSLTLYSQVDSTTFRTNLDDVLEDATIDNEESGYYDLVEYLLQNKIPLNRASINELMRIPYLDRRTATTIIRYRNILGGMNSADQLKEIDGVDPELIEKILPFLRFGDADNSTFLDAVSNNFENVDISFRTRGINKIQKEQAFKDGKYDGSDWKIYNRLIVTKNRNVRFGILTEKDAGEKSINDFTTFHFFAENIGIIKNFVIGDFLYEFGQGLALWSRYSIKKGTETVGILPRNGKSIIPYLSSDENMFLRGVAAQINFNNLNVSSFFSSRQLDGSIDSSTNKITSIRLDGLNRNTNEIAHKRIIREKLFGISANYNLGEIGSIGFLYYNSSFGNDFQNESLYDPSGKNFKYLSASYNFIIDRLTFSGETSNNMKSFATINSMEISVNKNLALLFSYRNYSSDYWGLHTNGFGEKDGTQNEVGFYLGIKLRTNFGSFFFYYDQFKFPYTSDKIPFPSKGNEFMIYYTVSLFANTEFRLRYITKKSDVADIVNDEYGFSKRKTENIRGELIYKFSKNVQLRSRINLVGVTQSSNSVFEKGFLIFQDVKYTPISQINLSARIVFFKTDSYNSRVYEFENDLTGIMTNPALYGEGTRWYIIVQYRTTFGLTLSMKYSELFKPNERILGSGDTEIQGNVDNKISLQLDFQL
ncbi:MAG: helix-hairpin-helix domain-containing protein [Ignavibacteriales bacterium]|nr:helix-hairpin-helix domain-containing protein [Ignavibacteriales bacterium]